ncbi:DNA topoisomerase (ATP-hydrolyzing) subunit B [Candidatus Micrarchaeota archaeon]|nr:DNA topoisomerase (ATP-hydrolyzing) subunit B [Candidatus Micrarchaeota archaeon]
MTDNVNEPQDEYTAKDIVVLKGLDAVRRRPAMYIGDTGTRGLHHLIYEVVDNSIDEAMAGYCDDIEVVIRKDNSVRIKDNGRGIPISKHESGKSALEIVMTVLHAGGKFKRGAYQVSGGLHGVGLSVVNALSEWTVAQVYRDGKIYQQAYKRGIPEYEVKVVGESDHTGTIITFKPDAEIFKDINFNYDIIESRLRELAFLNKGVKITLFDERSSKGEVFHYKGGIEEFIKYQNRSKTPLHTPFIINKKSNNVIVDIAGQYTDSFTSTILTFANNINTKEGGFHLIGFRAGLTRAINEYVKANKLLKDGKLTGDDVKEGLTAIVSVKLPNPQFEGQTKTKLGNSYVKGIVESITYDGIHKYLEEHPSEAKMIINKILSAAKARVAAQRAKELVRRKSVLESSVLPGKLADCEEKDPSKSELFIVEGESAGGSSKQGRSRKFQAILPLRGKILNVEKANLNKMLKNNEIRNLIVAIGTGIGDEFDLSKLRYHKIVIMTDADVDGAHITTLLLTFFYRYMKPLVEKGYIYIAQPPLYQIKIGKKTYYAYSDEEKDSILNEFKDQRVSVQRYKGLGEMNPQQLWNTTLDPDKRILLKVTEEDAAMADQIFSTLMGTEVAPRREFIIKHAREVRNLDI